MKVRWETERPRRYRMLVRSFDLLVETIEGPTGIERFTVLSRDGRRLALRPTDELYTVGGTFATAVTVLTAVRDGTMFDNARVIASFDRRWGFMRWASFEELHGRPPKWEPEWGAGEVEVLFFEPLPDDE